MLTAVCSRTVALARLAPPLSSQSSRLPTRGFATEAKEEKEESKKDVAVSTPTQRNVSAWPQRSSPLSSLFSDPFFDSPMPFGGVGGIMNDALRLQRSLVDSLLDQPLNQAFVRADPFRRSMTPTMAASWWAPTIDVEEKDSEIIFKADIPGVDKKDLQVQVDEQGILRISGSREQEFKSDDENMKRVERSYGSFERAFRLPATAVKETSELKAKLKDGVLTVTVPKRDVAKDVEKRTVLIE
eukprot:gb/GEZN01009034.1/.p1 GENE.gb/GEZN01009034.1/~~gb/GEZN01009034.1/.p1  ORF type:complete len:242 (-),score=25.03 gb/GEZN01009034.1/:557-1282(-)